MSAPEADFYDAAMTERGALAMLPLKKSPWRPLYAEAASWIASNEPVEDLGCGTGRFAAELESREHAGGYHGYDFSPLAIAEAKRYMPGCAFAVSDLRVWQPRKRRAGNTVYTCLETLEHLDDDLGLVARVPPGHRLIFSVPNYHSEAHVRLFPSVADVWRRYEGLVSFRRWSLLDLGGAGKAIHVLDSVRRIDAWT